MSWRSHSIYQRRVGCSMYSRTIGAFFYAATGHNAGRSALHRLNRATSSMMHQHEESIAVTDCHVWRGDVASRLSLSEAQGLHPQSLAALRSIVTFFSPLALFSLSLSLSFLPLFFLHLHFSSPYSLQLLASSVDSRIPPPIIRDPSCHALTCRPPIVCMLLLVFL